MRRRDRLGAHNERVKLGANSVNAVGLAFVALGIVRPLVDPDVNIGIAGFVFGTTGLALHALAHYILKQLETET